MEFSYSTTVFFFFFQEENLTEKMTVAANRQRKLHCRSTSDTLKGLTEDENIVCREIMQIMLVGKTEEARRNVFSFKLRAKFLALHAVRIPVIQFCSNFTVMNGGYDRTILVQIPFSSSCCIFR